ncbi:MAG: FmdB family zinc ribbon protein [Tepidisphaeraceae bacterium]
MPTYEYICEACEHEFEQFQSIKADPIKECPVCHKLKVRRKIGTGAGILFKGGGFYETDYRSKGYQDAAKKDKEAGGAKSESKADAPAKTEAQKSESPKADAPKAEKPAAPAPAAAPAKSKGD